jgi:hypothetical protein
MKNLLISALFVVSAAFTPCLRNAVEFPDRAYEAACEIAKPLFWQLWDELLHREIAGAVQPTANAGEESEWQVKLRADIVVCIVVHLFLKHALDGSLSVAERDDTFLVSIPSSFIRRTTERQFSRVAQLPAI